MRDWKPNRYHNGLERLHESLRPTRRQFLAGAAWLPFRSRGEVAVGGSRFLIVRRGRSNRRYVHIHGDEPTAREVLQEYLKTHDGTGFFIQSDTRVIPLANGEIDPNRMFSDVGAAANLKRLNHGWSDAQVERALEVLRPARKKLLKELLPPPGGLVFAIHNNAKGYSMLDEIEASDKVSRRRPDEPHEFFLCTRQASYDVLTQSPYNVVLQTAGTPDDGSLSRLCARRNTPYVNLECGVGKREIQREMFEWAASRLA